MSEDQLQNEWWGYLHTNGTVHVKRFFDHQDIVEAGQSDFVQIAVGPFRALNRDEAIVKAEATLL